jgi:hypothetical protein
MTTEAGKAAISSWFKTHGAARKAKKAAKADGWWDNGIWKPLPPPTWETDELTATTPPPLPADKAGDQEAAVPSAPVPPGRGNPSSR